MGIGVDGVVESGLVRKRRECGPGEGIVFVKFVEFGVQLLRGGGGESPEVLKGCLVGGSIFVPGGGFYGFAQRVNEAAGAGVSASGYPFALFDGP